MPRKKKQDRGRRPKAPHVKTFDELMKRLFSYRAVVASFLKDELDKESADQLDLSKLTEANPDYILPQGGGSCDSAWQVPFKDGQTIAIILFEFQAKVDPLMAARMLQAYGFTMMKALRQASESGPSGRVIYSFVIYHGPGKWTAKQSIREVANMPSLTEQTSGMQADFRFEEVSMLAYSGPTLHRKHSVWGLILRIANCEQDFDAKHEWRAFRALAMELGLERLGDDLAELFVKLGRERGSEAFPVDKLDWTMEEVMEIVETNLNFMSGVYDRGATAGRKELLARQCRTRYGQDCASSLAKLLKPVNSTATLDKVGDWIISCASADEFLAKVQAGTAARRSASSNGAT